MAQPTRQTVAAARQDVGVFAQQLLGQALWPHQTDLARSTARVTTIISGRQAGKSTALAVTATHEAFRSPDRKILLVSAGDTASMDLLSQVSAFASSPLLAGSVVDDGRHQVTFTNGSTIRSVPASEAQIRGLSVDLLIIDEACFVAEEIWQAARYTTIARPDSRVILASTPWGRQDRFCALAYRAGMRGEAGHASFHWPSTASPMVDDELLAIWRGSSADREYRREVLAEWVDSAGQYFSDAELEAAVCDYELVPPDKAHRRHRGARGGVDWGFIRDSSAVAVLAEAAPGDLPGDWPARTFFVPWIDEGIGVTYAAFVRRVVDVAKGYRLSRLASETNGVGEPPTQDLQRLLGGRGGRVVPVATTASSKQNGFGAIKLLLGQGRLALPRHPRLLAQLAALEFEERDSGTVRIAVPERSGHDDLCMALMLSVGVGDVASPWSGSQGVQVPVGRIPLPKSVTRSTPATGPTVVREGEKPDTRTSRQRFNDARRDPRYTRPRSR